MNLTINTNVPALIAQRQLNLNTLHLSKSFRALSTGSRINVAGDDAAGLSISEQLRTQIRGNDKAIQNAQDGLNVINIAEGAFASISEHIQRIRELTVQAANDTNGDSERTAIAQEVAARMNDIDRIANSTRSNGVYLLNGSVASFALQVGPNASVAANVITMANLMVSSFHQNFSLAVASCTIAAGGYFESAGAARGLLSQLANALSVLHQRRGGLGAMQNRLETVITNLNIQYENLSAMDSRIRDTDIAKETANLTKYQILQQAAVSILAQANQSPSLALSLLGVR